MSKMRFILIVALICVISSAMSGFGHSTSYVACAESIPPKNTWDTVLLLRYHLKPKQDTVIKRPKYKVNNLFMERLLDSFFTLPRINQAIIFFKYPIYNNNYIITSSFDFIIPEVPFTLDSITGVCGSLIIYNVSDSILDGFWFDKMTDSVYMKFWNPELWLGPDYPDYYLLLKARKRESDKIGVGIFRGNKMIDLDSCEKFKWIGKKPVE